MNPETHAGLPDGLFELIHHWLAYQIYIDELPGLSVGIALGGRTVFHEQFGFADLEAGRPLRPDTLFRIASHSKLFTATAVMRLVPEGRLRLDDPVAQHLAWFPLEQVTIRQLLTHSSGLVRDGNTRHWTYDEAFPDRESIRSLAEKDLAIFSAGEHLKYSNLGFALLGEVIAAAAGRPYTEAVRELVLAPLGLADTVAEFSEDLRAWHATGYGVKYPGEKRSRLEHRATAAMGPATGFSSTAADLLRFYRAHSFGGSDFLTAAERREMQGIQFAEGEYAWGLGFRLQDIGGLQYACHGGRYPGYISFSGLNQENRLTIVVLTNAVDGPARELFKGISGLVQIAIKRPERFFDDRARRAELDVIAGFYRSLWGTRLFGRIGGKLVGFDPSLKDPASDLDVFENAGSGVFRVPHRNPYAEAGEEIRFVTGNLGKAESVLSPASSAHRWNFP